MSHTRKDAIETLGTIIDENAGRDAIHVAVEPVIAAEPLFAGQHIGFVNGGVGKCDKPLGIVDPYLTKRVEAGERFWMLLYPRTITSLRHVWLHPAFTDEKTTAKPDKAASEKWLREFCNTHDCPSYDEVLTLAVDNTDGEYLHSNGADAHGEIPDEFWNHVEILTGTKCVRAKYFSCSC